MGKTVQSHRETLHVCTRRPEGGQPSSTRGEEGTGVGEQDSLFDQKGGGRDREIESSRTKNTSTSRRRDTSHVDRAPRDSCSVMESISGVGPDKCDSY